MLTFRGELKAPLVSDQNVMMRFPTSIIYTLVGEKYQRS
jgi:hypothetical protein